jgi:hypothetical protein
MSATSIGWVKEDNIVYKISQKRTKTMVELAQRQQSEAAIMMMV